jgi:hypothetical protein
MPNIYQRKYFKFIYLFMQLFFLPKTFIIDFFSSDSLMAKLTHLNMENCGIQDLNSDHSNNILVATI